MVIWVTLTPHGFLLNSVFPKVLCWVPFFILWSQLVFLLSLLNFRAQVISLMTSRPSSLSHSIESIFVDFDSWMLANHLSLNFSEILIWLCTRQQLLKLTTLYLPNAFLSLIS